MLQEATDAKSFPEVATVSIEQLRHSAPVSGLQWSHGDLYSGALPSCRVAPQYMMQHPLSHNPA